MKIARASGDKFETVNGGAIKPAGSFVGVNGGRLVGAGKFGRDPGGGRRGGCGFIMFSNCFNWSGVSSARIRCWTSCMT